MAQSRVTRHGITISAQWHDGLKYLDNQHILRRTINELEGTANDLRMHLLDHHGATASGRSRGHLARLHLTMHAVGAMFDGRP